MRDHRPDHDPTPVDITEQLRRVARKHSALRVTPPDWRLRTRSPKTAKTQAKIRRKQAHESRKRNR